MSSTFNQKNFNQPTREKEGGVWGGYFLSFFSSKHKELINRILGDKHKRLLVSLLSTVKGEL